MDQNNQVDSSTENQSPSGYGTEATQTPQDTKAAQAERMYGKPDQGVEQAAGATEQKTEAAPESKQESVSQEDASGYLTGEAKPTEAKPTEDKPFEINTETLDEVTVKEVQEFAKVNGLTKEQAQAVADKYKALVQDQAKYKADHEKTVKETHKKWEEDLRRDSDFGGANFAKSVHNVNKLLNENMPGLKNLLTSGGKRLPPSVMKDLNSLAKRMYGETEFNQGQAVSQKDTWKPTDFYNSKT